MSGNLRDRRVRDLAWAIGSPPLCREPPGAFARWVNAEHCAAERATLTPWLQALDQDPSALREHLQARGTRRLGHYFEALTSFWLARAPGYTRLAEGVVLQREGRTLGELDFIYEREGRVRHLEVAVKFYLRAADAPTPSSYVGPSLRDRFDLKLSKLEREQSRRLQSGGASLALEEEGVYPHEAEVRLKGVLFEPWGAQTELPPEVDDSHLSGHWIETGRVNAIQTDGEWHILDKLEWLSGPAPDRPGLSFGAMVDLLSVKPFVRPIQVCERASDGELRRVFIVPDDFILRARETLS